MTDKTAHVRIKDVGNFPNLAPSLGAIVGCVVQELDKGYFMYHVPASSFINLGCDVGKDNLPFPFYSTEVEVIHEG